MTQRTATAFFWPTQSGNSATRRPPTGPSPMRRRTPNEHRLETLANSSPPPKNIFYQYVGERLTGTGNSGCTTIRAANLSPECCESCYLSAIGLAFEPCPMTALSGLQQNHWRITENSIIDRYFLPEKTPTRRFGDPPAVDFRFITAPRGGFAAAPEHHRNWCQTIQNLHPTRTSVIIRSAQAPTIQPCGIATNYLVKRHCESRVAQPNRQGPTGSAPTDSAPTDSAPTDRTRRRVQPTPPPAPRQRRPEFGDRCESPLAGLSPPAVPAPRSR